MLIRSVFGLTLSCCFPIALGLWPAPSSLTSGNSTLLLSPSFSFSPLPGTPQDVSDALNRTLQFLVSDQLERLVVGRGASDAPSFASAKTLSSLKLSFTGTGALSSISSEAIKDLTSRDEAYTLSIPADGSGAVLAFNSSLGLFRGLTTFSQLWYDLEGTTYALGLPMIIQDKPAYVRSSAY